QQVLHGDACGGPHFALAEGMRQVEPHLATLMGFLVTLPVGGGGAALKLGSGEALGYAGMGRAATMRNPWTEAALRFKIWRRGKSGLLRTATDRVIAHRTNLLTQWADEAGFGGQVQYLHEATSPAGSWAEASWSSPGSTIGLTRSAFYDSVMRPKSIFHHEIGHFLLNGGDEVASTQAAIRFLLQ